MLDEALLFARDDATAEAPATIDLASMMQTLVDDQTDLGAEVKLQMDVHPYVAGQPTALKRALSNVLDNAVRYGGSAEVQVIAPATVRIIDAGTGMTPEEANRAVEPFVRLEGSRNRDTGGTGLGLAIASNVIKRHGGTLGFSHTEDGFCAEIQLPVSDA